MGQKHGKGFPELFMRENLLSSRDIWEKEPSHQKFNGRASFICVLLETLPDGKGGHTPSVCVALPFELGRKKKGHKQRTAPCIILNVG